MFSNLEPGEVAPSIGLLSSLFFKDYLFVFEVLVLMESLLEEVLVGVILEEVVFLIFLPFTRLSITNSRLSPLLIMKTTRPLSS
jgi:hypothetical protein